jgi:PAS domain S-box-containing protein
MVNSIFRVSRWSIRQKVQGIIMATCAIALLLASLVFTIYDRATFLRLKTEDLEASAQLLGANSTAAISFGDAGAATEMLTALRAKPQVIASCIYRNDGSVFAEYRRDQTAPMLRCPPFQKSATSIRDGRMQLFRNIKLNNETIGTVYIEQDLKDIRERLIGFSETAVIVLLLALFVAFLLSSWLQALITDPILRLASTALSVSAHEDYTVRAAKNSNDEIGILFDEFNGMLDRIQQRDAQLLQEQQGLERRVEARTAYLNALIDNNPLAILVLNLQGKIELCNPAFEKLFQFSRQEAIGVRVSDLLGSSESDDLFVTIMAGNEIHQVTRRYRRDKSVVDVELNAVSLLVNGEPTGCLAIYQDISIRKRSEEALRRAKEAAEAANAAKSQFLANMSHEIRTPMNGIMGMTELVLDTQLDQEQREYLNLAKMSADSLLLLIDDILDYSKIEAGKLEMDAASFDLSDCLTETMKSLSLRAHQKGLELALEVQPDVPNILIGDRGRLRQVIVNLLGNSIKFTEQGEVVISAAIESRTDTDIVLHFTVSDTGIGIPKDKQVEIFEAFRQADGSMTRKYGGTGLGLSITLRLVELMGGRIWVESELGEGSRFHFTARFALQRDAERIVIPVHPDILCGMRVLVVDDNATNRQILVRTLSTWLMKPTAVASGAEAIAVLEEECAVGRAFALVLLDAQMPEMDGFSLAGYMKQNQDFTSATVMMLSSAGQRGEALRCKQLGIAAYLTKPVSSSDLLASVLSALGTAAKSRKEASLAGWNSLRVDRHGLRVLLAEDNPVNQILARRMLEKLGHTITVASNGREALEALAQVPFDLIFLDVQMPEMNGIDAVRAIRENEKATGSHIPIIALTAHAMSGDRELCLEVGFDGYLSKPMQGSKLKLEIQRVMELVGVVSVAQDGAV